MEPQYSWREGSRHVVDAKLAFEALECIRQRHGALTAPLIVQESRSESAPLHPEFEWDDQKAAERYREEQARYIARSIVVVYSETQTAPVRAFVHVEMASGSDAPPEPVYVKTVNALADPELRRQVLRRALTEAAAWQRRYEELEELTGIFRALGEVRQHMLAQAS